MPYKNSKIVIPLCKTDAKAYRATKDATIHIVNSAKECLAHYVDLDTITCLERKRKSKAKGCKTKHIFQSTTKDLKLIELSDGAKWCWRCSSWIKPKSIDRM
jgi:hypothetical protein